MLAKGFSSKIILLILISIVLTVSIYPSMTFGHDYHPIEGGEGSNDPNENRPKGIWDLIWNLIKYLAKDGEPVHLDGGEYYLSTTDLYIQGRVLDVVITRRYSSRSEYNSRFGYGWDMNYNLKVRKPHNVYKIIQLSGLNRKLEHTLDPNSDPNKPVYTSPAGLYDCLIENQDGTSTLVKKYGTKLDFDINGNLSSITDRNGNSITFTYDAIGLLPLNGRLAYVVGLSYGLVAMEYKLVSITDDLNRQINFNYNSNGLLSTITDFTGRTWTYTYDPSTNDLLTVTRPPTSEYPSGLTTTYTYDENHNLLTITDPNGQTYLTNTYDANDMVSQQTYGYGDYIFSYDQDNNKATVTDRRGFDSTIVYNSTGNPISVTIDTNGLREDDPDFYTTSFEYNSDIEITKKTFPAGNWIGCTYDTAGNLLTVCQEPNNGDPNILTTYTYDPNFNFVKTMTDPRGNVVTFDYNGLNGNLERITYPVVSTPQGDASPIVSFTYNQYGQVETVTAPDGIVTKYEYYDDINDPNNYGRLWKIIVDANESDPDRLEITTTFKYDEYGNIAEVNDPNSDITQFVHNELDQLIRAIAPSPFSFQTNFFYTDTNKLDHIERVRAGDNQLINYTYNILDKLQTTTDSLGNVTTISYDNNENLSDVNDPEGNITHYDYDERDLLWKVTDANNNVTEYSYDYNGNLKQIEDPNGDITTYQYDGFDRLICITYPDDTNEVFGYDKNSNLTSLENRKGDTIYYEYDALNRLIVKNQPGDPNIEFTYDIADRLWDVNDGGKVTEYYYDRIGRVTDVNDPEDRLVGYEYDDRGLRTKLIYPDDSFITYEYDALWRLTKIIDDSNNILAQYQYDELSRRTLLTLGNDANAVYEYDLNNRLIKLANNIDDSNSIVFEYSDYDKVGNRLSMKFDDANAHAYAYDNLYQLTFVDYNDGNSVSYTYDSLGNRTNVNDGSPTSYVRNCLNQYTSVGGTSYSYDDNGNLIDDGLFKYYYDCENRLIDVNDQNDAPIASYSYDYLGRRVSKTVYGTPDVTTRYCYDGDHVIAEYEGSDNLLRKYVYGAGIDEPICMVDTTDSNAVYYYHFDGLGSVVALSDVNNVIVERYSYDVFGGPTVYDVNSSEISQSAIGNPYMFTSRRADDETALYYYRARYYAFDIGRFLQTDPVGYVNGLNLYTYCGNNPINFYDPSGLCKEFFKGSAVGIAQILAFVALGAAVVYFCPPAAILLAKFAPYLLCTGALISGWEMGIGIGGIDPWTGRQLTSYERGVHFGRGLTGSVGSIYSAARFRPNISTQKLTGQRHHAISRPIHRALSRHPNLRGQYKAYDPRFTTRAKDLAYHHGYQHWHRQLDAEMKTWLIRNRKATPTEFENFLRWRYSQPDLIDRFPGGLGGD